MKKPKTMLMSEIEEARRRLNLPGHVPSAAIVTMIAGTGIHARIQMYLAWQKVVSAFKGEIAPVKFPQANGKLSGGNIAEDMPVCRTADNKTCSCWRVPFWKRLQVLVTGRLYLIAKGTSIPPMCVETEVFWK